MFPYNPCMVVGDDIWVAGQIGIDGGDSMAEQAASALSKIDALLGEAESDKADLVMVMVPVSYTHLPLPPPPYV